MAERRMLKGSLIKESRFRGLASATQMLYVLMLTDADDDGFIGDGRRYAKMMGFNPRRLDELCKTGYLIPFDSGVYAITHWNEHNKIGGIKHRVTNYPDALAQLTTDRQGRYVAAY